MNICSRCGSKDISVMQRGGFGWYVKCKTCGLMTTNYKTKQDAIMKWDKYYYHKNKTESEE
jgi:uncharacterized Zn finger protein